MTRRTTTNVASAPVAAAYWRWAATACPHSPACRRPMASPHSAPRRRTTRRPRRACDSSANCSAIAPRSRRSKSTRSRRSSSARTIRTCMRANASRKRSRCPRRASRSGSRTGAPSGDAKRSSAISAPIRAHRSASTALVLQALSTPTPMAARHRRLASLVV